MTIPTTRPEIYPGIPVTEGMLMPRDRTLLPIPLKHTDIQANIIGPLAHVHVTQQFHNTHTKPLEAIYTFPLPEDAAVTDLTVTIGERIIKGTIRERQKAQEEYADARDAGQGAALLEQERPNIFTISVANIQPDERVQVQFAFHDRVPYENSTFAFVLPTVVLPRYTPEDPEAAPDAHRIQTPLIPEETRDGHTLSVRVALDVGKLHNLSSPSHDIDVEKQHGMTLVTLRQADSIPNKDFILRYGVSSDQFETALFTYRSEQQPGTALLMLTPHADYTADDVMPREVLFVLDRSGSMGGDGMQQARNALRACLRALNPGDRFNIFPFDNHVEQFSPQACPFTQEAIDASDAYIDHIDARGGTDILKALQRAFEQPRDREYLRVVVFLTDGAVSNEDQVLRTLRKSLNEARVYAFGIGSAVNRFLLDKLAEVGRGSVEYIFPGQGIEEAIQRFQNRAAFPLLTDVEVDWGGAKIVDVYPEPLPDLYAGQPLVLLTRFHSKKPSTIRLRGRTRYGTYEQTLEVDWPESTPDRSDYWKVLPAMWARARIDALMTQARDDKKKTASVRDEILALALEHNLLSPYTALIAIEERRPEHADREQAEQCIVPIHLPQGTNREAFEQPERQRACFCCCSAPPSDARGGGMLRMASASKSAKLRGRSSLGTLGIAESIPSARFADADADEMDFSASPSAYAYPQEPAPDRQAKVSASQRYDAALRYLSRNQKVSGAWGDESPVATVLVVLAFLQGGHTDRSGAYRPQMTRAVSWLIKQTTMVPVAATVAWALSELATTTATKSHKEACDRAVAAVKPTNDDELECMCLALAQHMTPPSTPMLPEKHDEWWALAVALLAKQHLPVPDDARSLLMQHQEFYGGNDGGVLLPGVGGGKADTVVCAATAALALLQR